MDSSVRWNGKPLISILKIIKNNQKNDMFNYLFLRRLKSAATFFNAD